MKIGILFGGKSREREISFAGGRTVYDLLDKTLFTPVPIFVDSLGHFIELDWQYLYKGSIRDFYPGANALQTRLNGAHSRDASGGDWQIYIESLEHLSEDQLEYIINKVGKRIRPEELNAKIDFAFLTLHGPYGEDGSIQGLLSFYNIPYSGSGILPSAIGIDKKIQKNLMQQMGILAAKAFSISRKEWMDKNNHAILFEKANDLFDLPVVIKSSSQGSSIGVSILKEWDYDEFRRKINQSLFIKYLHKREWQPLNETERKFFIHTLSDIYEGIGIPIKAGERIIYHPEDLYNLVENHFKDSDAPIMLESLQTEGNVLIEEFIDGKEFSCIVIEGENGEPIALPPTEILKKEVIFDYRAKYLPGIARKITPIQLPEETIERICAACEKLYMDFQFDVYARIDGIIKKDGSIYLNDPNTTSGMLPSSFFFHQAAEIGLSPSQFLTYIVRKSLQKRIETLPSALLLQNIADEFDKAFAKKALSGIKKQKIAVILGGVSTERHISVESGRNVFEKLSSSGKYEVTPVFLTSPSKAPKMGGFESPFPALPKGEGVKAVPASDRIPGAEREVPPSGGFRGALPRYMTADVKAWQHLKEFSLENRKNPTLAEKLLWKKLSNAQIGYNVRRQHVIDIFIVDFVILSKNLIIEIDGEIHNQQKEDDELRTKILNDEGFKVIRFTNDEVVNNIDLVVSQIKEAANNLNTFPALPKGEGVNAAPASVVIPGAEREVPPLGGFRGADTFQLYTLPLNLLLKDNADDIKNKAKDFKIPPIINRIIKKAEAVTKKYALADYEFYPREITLDELKGKVDFAFIALHGRPGEDGSLQELLEAKHIPYNGSGPESSSITINKFITNELLRVHGFLIPEHALIKKEDWKTHNPVTSDITNDKINYPFIAKPADDGCSSAVKKINNAEQFTAFSEAMFREKGSLTKEQLSILSLKADEEFPMKDFFVVEELVGANGAERFMEITGGMFTYTDDNGQVQYEVFEASEALAEKGILSLEEKFLAGEGQNITPARYSSDAEENSSISSQVKEIFRRAAIVLQIEGYCRIDAFVRIYNKNHIEVVFIEVNSLPGLTPATCIFHQAALDGYKPVEFLEKIIGYGLNKKTSFVRVS